MLQRARHEERRLELEAGLPREPPADHGETIIIKFRRPNGRNFKRRFLVESELQVRYLQIYPNEF